MSFSWVVNRAGFSPWWKTRFKNSWRPVRHSQVEVYLNFRNNWLSNYHSLEEEGDEKWYGSGWSHCQELEMYQPKRDQVSPLHVGTFLTKCSIILPVSISWLVPLSPTKDSCHLWLLDERVKDRGAFYGINFDALNTFFWICKYITPGRRRKKGRAHKVFFFFLKIGKSFSFKWNSVWLHEIWTVIKCTVCGPSIL